jgi:hypothetical protein
MAGQHRRENAGIPERLFGFRKAPFPDFLGKGESWIESILPK